MKKNLFLRTDTLPEEIPVLFSNKAVYLNFTKKRMDEILNIDNVLNFVTVPFFFYIPKSKDEKRKIGLLHPIAQIQAFNYILRYEQLIISFCKNSPYSVRSPIKRNIPKFKDVILKKKEIKKIEEEYNFSDKLSVTSDEDQILFYNYFSYNKHKKITGLYNSIKFNRDKYKYNYFLKLDIQRCFPSIYTHSLAWAIFGEKSLAKKYKEKKYKYTFPNASDSISQRINFNETHGLVVGPEFSRVIAELLLTRIDVNLYQFTKEQNLEHKKDYSLYRFIDDYFIFAKNKKDIELIEQFLKIELDKYNLALNIGKTALQEKPFEIYDNSIISLKKILKEFEFDKMLASMKIGIDYDKYKGKLSQWDDLFYKMENLISNHNESKTRIINYFLKTIRSSIFFDGNPKHKFIIANILEIVSNIFTLEINSKSTSYLISIYIKLFKQMESQKKELELSIALIDLKTHKDETDIRDLLLQKKKLESIEYLNEKMFQHLFSVLKNNMISIDSMYDILIFMKLFEKKLSANFLCEILTMHKESYFVCCSIAYYILDEKLNSIDNKYITVVNKLSSIIDSNINNYSEKGATHRILEGEFFYFLNDFSKYPGFRNSQITKYNKLLMREYKSTIKGTPEVRHAQLEMWESITRYSYYDWNTQTDTFIRKIVKKSSNMAKIDSTSEY
ncbi:hypothetical protein B0533_02510 [Sedimentibacter sp. SX930]|nr:hypothetical protein B0533_02510 [Sedimentibacter sp. SX930]